MAGRRSLIIVSNRGPVTFDRGADGARVVRRGGGGLVTALRGLLEHHDVTWIAAATTDEDRVVAAEGSSDAALVAPEPDTYHGYYNVVANPMLWFIQHGLWGRGLRPDLDEAFHAAWRDYETVNRLFAERVVVELDNSPGAAVLFQDYHLYLAPGYVRAARPDAKLAHFVHIPWPVDWTILPEAMRRAVHEGPARERRRRVPHGALGAELRGELRRDRRRPRPDARHAPRDLDRHRRVRRAGAVGPPCSPRRRRSRRRVRRSSCSASTARIRRRTSCAASRRSACCSTRIPSGAAARSCSHCSIRHGSRSPSTSSTSRRSSARPRSQRAASRTRSSCRSRTTSSASVAAYKQFDVLLVNAVYDGLNLVAKEAPLVNARDGVLVLSENAGAHEELGEWCLTVNPFDVWGQAEALHEALSMDAAERQRRIDGIRAQVRANDVHAWIDGLLADLDAV